MVLTIEGTASAQDVRTVSIDSPEVTFDQGFTHVVGVRQLADGRVIVLDSHERTIVVFGNDGRVIRTLGRSGSGPGEFLMPSSILAVSGDSTLIRDGPNNRFLVITPDAVMGDILDLLGQPPGGPPPPLGVAMVRFADQRGHFYAQAQAILRRSGGEYQLIDSAAIERWTDRSAGRDTIAFIYVRHVPGTTAARGFVAYRAKDRPAYWTSPQWAVSSDGWLAIANDAPYRIDTIDPNGRRHFGEPIPTRPVRVTDAMKQRWCEDRGRPQPMLTSRRDGTPATVQMVRMPCDPPKAWPEFIPPFLPGAVSFAVDGSIWVNRTFEHDNPVQYDVVSRAGRLVGRVRLPESRRLVGFGDGWVYLVRRDEFDLEYVERHALPAFRSP
jgi:hypothetical protein